jgi:hypothetical protein
LIEFMRADSVATSQEAFQNALFLANSKTKARARGAYLRHSRSFTSTRE